MAQRTRIGIRHFRGACMTRIFITVRVVARYVVRFPKILTMAPVNPHL
ncbi:hypothetical protein OH687_19385 [Burkholderia anthina]|nr:hypothetical protein OH687_19385 [Burkholderia anthina]